MVVFTVIPSWPSWWRERNIDLIESGGRRTRGNTMSRWARWATVMCGGAGRFAVAMEPDSVLNSDLRTELTLLQRTTRLIGSA